MIFWIKINVSLKNQVQKLQDDLKNKIYTYKNLIENKDFFSSQTGLEKEALKYKKIRFYSPPEIMP